MTKTNPKFTKIYQALNPAQKKAVNAIEGPVMVVAGPGTGKTQVLAARIANILLKTDTPPASILALTFTESAAHNMQARVVEMIGATGYQVRISTFHAFCQRVILQYPEYFAISHLSQPLSDLEKFQIVTDLILHQPLKILRPLNDPLHYLRDIIKAISDLKREGILPGELEKMIEEEFADLESMTSKTKRLQAERNQQKNLELLELFKAYQKKLIKTQRYDFDDMVTLVIGAFAEHELLLLEQQEELHYFLVDEYQDTNSAQNQVIWSLASYWGDKANIFVVGDPQQSIFRFQGASLENVSSFVDHYPGVQVINLNLGYRCPQTIYDAAHWLIGHSHQYQTEASALKFLPKQALKSTTDGGKNQSAITLFGAPSRQVELLWVVESVQKLLKQKVDPAQIAVLYRKNQESFELMELFDKYKIRYEVAGGGNVLKAETTRQLIEFLRVILQLRTFQAHPNLFEVLVYDWSGVDRLAVYRLTKMAGSQRQSLVEVIENYQPQKSSKSSQTTQMSPTGPTGLTGQEFKPIHQTYQKMIAWGLDDLKTALPNWFTTLAKESGYLDWVMKQPNRIELVLNLNTLYDLIKSLSSQRTDFKLADLVGAIDLMIEHNLSLETEDLDVTTGTVHLSTVHKAKGREWQYVFVVGLNDGVWGNLRRAQKLKLPDKVLRYTDISELEKNDEERRLFYVAITRASQQVYLSYPQTKMQYQRSLEVIGSQFLVELSQDEAGKTTGYITQSESVELLAHAQDKLSDLLQPSPSLGVTGDEKRFFKHLAQNMHLSVSSLNKYLQSPEEFVLDVLLKLPKAKVASMAFGTAYHLTLEAVNQHLLKTRQVLPLPEALERFRQALKAEILTKDDYEGWLKRGQDNLTQYLEQDLAGDQIIMAEQQFGFPPLATYLGDIHLTGKIDRVDWLDRDKKLVRVIDYKTGKARSVNDIEGRTQTSRLSEREQTLPEGIRGPYKRQLVFYKLLTQLAPEFPHQAVEGVLEFVEPVQPSGKFVSRRFELLDGDVRDLKKLIREVMAEIRGLKFLELI
ncbi:MAG: ATP-dependent DNA helicase [Patescibacteria group bacterium]|nr:ATP-dependent helicase [Patescibacteria group bacterium]